MLTRPSRAAFRPHPSVRQSAVHKDSLDLPKNPQPMVTEARRKTLWLFALLPAVALVLVLAFVAHVDIRHVFRVLAVILGIVTAMLGFLEIAIGDEGQKALQSRLIDWYFYVEEGGLSRIVVSSAKILDTVLSAVLGRRIISLRAIALSLLIYVIALLTLQVATGDVIAASTFSHFGLWRTFAIYLPRYSVLFALADFPFLCASRLILRRFETAVHVNRPLFQYAVLAYVALGFAQYVVSIYGVLHRVPFVSMDIAAAILLRAILWPIWVPIFLRSDTFLFARDITLYRVAFVFALSTVMLAPILLSAFLVYITRPASEPLALALLARLSNTKKGVLTAVIAILTAVSTVLSSVGLGR